MGGLPLEIIKTQDAGTILYRARRDDGTLRGQPKDFGPPPKEKTPPGRMNPAGIPYFYLAENRETAIAEAMDRPQCKLKVALFKTTKDLRLLDLTALPLQAALPPPTENDPPKQIASRFLVHFRNAISQPVTRDQKEIIEYIPSQIICEYFALQHQFTATPIVDSRIDGIKYPSAVYPPGKNVVLFPRSSNWDEVDGVFSDILKFTDQISDHEITTWEDFQKAVLEPRIQ
jgi:RES domain-containing protein